MGQGSNRAPQGQERNLSKLNCCNISEEVGDMSILRVRKDGMLLGESGEMAIVRVRKDVMLLGEKWGNGCSERT